MVSKIQQPSRRTSQHYSNNSEIYAEIKHLYKEIFNFSNISKDFSYNDCIDWLNDKDYKLFSLEKKMKKIENPSKDHQNILQETKGFLQSLKTKMLENSNANFKDFSGLLNQYKKSLKTLETAQKNSQSPFTDKRPGNLNLEHEITSLKQNIMNKIDEAIIMSPQKTERENRQEAKEIKFLIEEKEELEREKVSKMIEKNQENKDPNLQEVYRYKLKLGKRDESIARLQ